MRFVLLAGFLAFGAVARASFDLVFVADEGTDQIHRFDGGTGTYLGTVGSGGPWVNPRTMTVDRANNVLFVGADNGIFQVDLWNGTLLAAEGVSANYGSALIAPGRYIFTPNGAYSILGGSILGESAWYSAINMPNTINRRSLDIGPNGIHVLTSTQLLRYTNPGFFGGSAVLQSTQALTTPGAMGQLSVGSEFTLAGDLSGNRLHSMFTSGGGYGTAQYLNFSTLTGVDFAHGDNFYVAGRNSGNTSGLVALSNTRIFGQSLRTFGTGILQNPTSVAVIVAPEPGTWTALALGACWLRRRKLKRS